MIFALLLATFSQCYSSSYSYYPQTYYTKSYQSYQNYAYTPSYVEKVVFAVVEPQTYYASLIGSTVRAEQRSLLASESETNLTAQVKNLTSAVGELEARILRQSAQSVAVPESQQTLASPQQQPQIGLQAPKKEIPTLRKVMPPLPSLQQPPQVPVKTQSFSEDAPEPPQGFQSPKPNLTPGETPQAVLAMLTSKCAKCHTGSSAQGGFTLFSAPNRLASLDISDKLLIDQQVYSGNMPRNGKPLDVDEYAMLRSWIDQDSELISASLKKLKGIQ